MKRTYLRILKSIAAIFSLYVAWIYFAPYTLNHFLPQKNDELAKERELEREFYRSNGGKLLDNAGAIAVSDYDAIRWVLADMWCGDPLSSPRVIRVERQSGLEAVVFMEERTSSIVDERGRCPTKTIALSRAGRSNSGHVRPRACPLAVGTRCVPQGGTRGVGVAELSPPLDIRV